MTIVLPTSLNIERAAKTLREGGIVAFATETVYGLGCDTFNPEAIESVYRLKGRPRQNPTIAHVLEPSWVEQLTGAWSGQCDLLAKAFWPGPLTIVLPKKEKVPEAACGGRNTIAVRSPSHSVARQLLTSFGSSISAPSANRSGYISPTTAKHVENEFGGKVFILDGGPCEEGIESTVLSLVTEPEILRPGTIPVQAIEEIIGPVTQTNRVTQTDSPGTTEQHYSPHTTVNLLPTDEINSINDNMCAVLTLSGKPKEAKRCFQMPSKPKEYGALLYSVLRDADSVGANQIAIEQPPQTADWHAIQDRLMRCAANTSETI